MENQSIEALLKQLNELWAKRVSRTVPFDENREESEHIIEEIIGRGYVIISEDDFITRIADSPEIPEELVAARKKISEEKAKAVQSKDYILAARLRDKEMRLRKEMMLCYFKKEMQDYFLLLENFEMIILYRQAKALNLYKFILNRSGK